MPMPDAETVCKLYQQAKTIRSPHENDWRMAAAYCLPAQYAGWVSDGPALISGKARDARRVNYDSTGARSLPKYASVLQRLATPDGQKWHTLTASDESLRRRPAVRTYFDALTTLLFKMRYHPKARFKISMSEVYTSLGVYGNGPVFIGERKKSAHNPVAGFKYVACSFRDVFLLVDDDGEITAVFRRFWLNARQFKYKFPDETPPPEIAVELAKPQADELKYFEFVHYVCQNEDYMPGALGPKRFGWSAAYYSITGKARIGKESGFLSCPYKVPRTSTISGDPYGYSPAVLALSSLGTASQIKKTVLKQGNKAVDPVMLAADDNAVNGEFDMRPGAINYGAIDRQGRELVKPLRTGDFRVAENLLADERRDTEDSFFVTLFQILNETPEMTATEVIERTAERASLIAPTMGRVQTELTGPTIEREIEVASELGVLPPMPPELVEAKGEYEVVYTSPMAKSMYAEEIGGFMRSVEMSIGISQAKQDPSALDIYDFDTALPEIAEHLAVPARWMKDPKIVKQERDQRNTQQQEQALLQNAGGVAAAAKTVTEMGAPGGK